ncbi:zinc finger protein 345-like [Eurosta solidaginis]|uniref:zinc finger protein 345-like n=1 Tax=Eurosta solidaginis TaxID=178769 RepID=UPI003530AA36
MAITSVRSFDCLCRTCMQKVVEVSHFETNTKADQNWQSLFDRIEECGTLRLAELLSNTIPQIEVQLNDELPQKICSKCVQQLLSVNRFQRMCIQSDQQMRALIVERAKYEKMSIMEEETSQGAIKGVGIASALPELPSSSAADPLQNIDVVIEYGKDESNNLSAFVKNEIYVDEHNTDYSDSEALSAIISAKNKVLMVESEEETVKLKGAQRQNLHTKKYHSIETTNIPLKQLSCHLCDELCGTRTKLAKHVKLRHPSQQQKSIKQYPCDECDETYKTRFKLAKHKKLQHSMEKQQNNPCDICGKSFQKLAALKAHERTHKGDRPHLCPECGKSFSQAGNLRQHILRHGDDKTFECPYCPSKFSCPNDVANHKIIHEGVKRHVCDICGYSFGKSNQLSMHKRYHNNVKPYKCDCCEMRFPRMSAQRRHMRTHTGEKPYKCTYCERAFAQTNDHMKHLRIHLGDNVYRCKLCPLAFPSSTDMRLHYATHKNEDQETRDRNMKALLNEEAQLQLKFAKSAKKSLEKSTNTTLRYEYEEFAITELM